MRASVFVFACFVGCFAVVGSCANVEAFDLCDNGVDDDGDGRTDCDDESCGFSDACGDCGDGVLGDNEACDDGNHDDGDGCSARCLVEGCTDPDGCGPDRTPLTPCGDSVLQPGEECEDGNHDDGDGCDASCHPERDRCDPNNGIDQCFDDDGLSGDGCSASCRPEFCGDGIVQPSIGERCDDAAPGASLVGCSGCIIAVCGNGIFEGFERCDDGNRRNGDGCSANCFPE